MLNLNLPDGKHAYFISDLHLGFPDGAASLQRERLFVEWVRNLTPAPAHLIFLGDIFDFWFEYKYLVPKGFSLFLAEIKRLKAKGVNILFFTGNHDLWMFDYFPQEFGVPVYHKPLPVRLGQLKLLIGHGDGLGPGDHTYKLMKAVFTNPACQWLFGWLNPNIGMWIAQSWSKGRKKRKMKLENVPVFLGEREAIWQYCQEVAPQEPYDFYLFGHRHIPMLLPVGQKGTYVNTGDWLRYFTYAQSDGKQLKLLYHATGQETPKAFKDAASSSLPLETAF